MIENRNASKPEISDILDWAAAEGWNPGLDDAAPFFDADPAGFFVAVDGEQPVAAISVVNHSDEYAFLGLYIVLPQMRGKGIGHSLWKHAIEHAGARTIGLDGVPEQQGNYASSGFEHAGGTTRYTGSIFANKSHAVRSVVSREISSLIDWEAEVSGAKKTRYLSGWFSPSPRRVTLVDEGLEGISGFCTVRRCKAGAKIGPLVADNPDSAERLIKHAATVFGADITIDVPDTSDVLSGLCQGFGLEPGFQTARMYRGQKPVGKDAIFAVTTLELG